MALAKMTAPNTYDRRVCRSTTVRILGLETAVSETWFRAEHVPEGISAEEHAAGLAASLRNLAAYVQAS